MSTRVSNAKQTIVAEASDWFVEFRAGDVTADARSRFDEWLRRSPEHIQAYLEVASAWSELPTADPHGRIDLPELIARARASSDDNVVPLSTGKTGRAAYAGQQRQLGAPRLAAAVAALAIAVGFAAWMGFYRADTYSTGIGEQRTVRLADGTTVELNALSSIEVRLSGNARKVDLTEGQALFHVAKDKTRPFTVRSGTTSVRAVGTQFDVYKRHDDTVVTVLEGRVAVAESSTALPLFDHREIAPTVDGSSVRVDVEPIYLSAGEQVTVTKKEVPRPRRADVAAATAWLQKRLIFDETPLADVAREFNRYSTRRLVISDPDLDSVAISGVYSTTDPDSLIGFLRAQPTIELSETATEIRIARRPMN